MKTTVRYIMLMAMIIAMAAGCSKSKNNDADSLLNTVPADASSVVVVNMERILDKLGCSTDGNSVKLSKELQKYLDESKSIKAEDRQTIKDLCDGKTGISITSIVYFSAARSYITGLLNDPDKFISYLSERNPADSTSTANPVVEENGAKIIGEATVIGHQFWICMTGRPDSEQIKYYSKLNERQSFTSTKAAPVLLDAEKGVAYVADVNRAMGSIPEAASMKMGASLMFEDLAYLSGDADIEKKSVKATAMALDSDMKPAKLLLPTEKIDTELIKSFAGNADFYFAIGLDDKLMDKIGSIAGSMMGNSASQAMKPLEQIDGTLAVVSDSRMKNIEAKIQTTGKDFAELSTVIQNLFGMSVTRAGNIITARSSEEAVTGKIYSSDAAGRLKGAWIGFVANDFPAREMTTSARLTADKGSLRLEIETEGGVDAIMTAVMK
ncbi:MAG: DUF4836 family protein [Muribaculaceae bacterium]|nr:DUF4836 family protein [Muribaculaceae bacterium]